MKLAGWRTIEVEARARGTVVEWLEKEGWSKGCEFTGKIDRARTRISDENVTIFCHYPRCLVFPVFVDTHSEGRRHRNLTLSWINHVS